MAVDGAKTIHTGERAATFNASRWAIGLIRVVLGVIFLLHGGQQVLGWFGGHSFSDSAAFMNTAMGIPTPLAYLSIFTQFVGGILLTVGVFSRLVGIGLIIDMAVAIALVHLKNGFFLGGGHGLGYEFNVALIAMALAVVIAGPGAAAIGDWEAKIFRR